MIKKTISETQEQIGEWADRNFPCDDRSRTALRVALGVAEETGELAHAILKRDQRIRDPILMSKGATYTDEAQGAVGDIVIFLMHLCHNEGWDIGEIIDDASKKVMQRDWIKYPRTGMRYVDAAMEANGEKGI
jgi:NTP pyrophosphatase (non-canonical NTP hydrolase)